MKVLEFKHVLQHDVVSAACDEELDSAQIDGAIEKLLADNQLRQQWRTHHLIRDITHGNYASGGSDLTSRVMQEILSPVNASDLQLKGSESKSEGVLRHHGWRESMIAASFVLMALSGWWLFEHAENTQEPLTVVATMDAVAETRMNEQRYQRRVESLLANHSAFSGNSQFQGVTPYARVVGYTAPAY